MQHHRSRMPHCPWSFAWDVRRPVSLALLGLVAPASAGGSERRPELHSPDSVRSVAAGTDGLGRLVVAWVSRRTELAEGGGEQLRAIRLEGTRWQPLGGVVNEKAQYNAAQPNVHTGPGGSVWLEWEEGSGHAHIDSYLMSNWTGSAWTRPTPYALRRNLSDAGRSRSLALDPQNRPLVGWTDIGTGTRSMYPSVVSLRLWRGQDWVTTPYLNLNLRQPAFMPSVAQVKGQVSVAYVEGATTRSNLWVRQWTGDGWRTLGGRVNVRPDTYVFRPLLRADGLGRLTVAWLEDLNGADALYVSRWTGRAWQQLASGPVSQPGKHAATASLAFDRHQRPVVAWTQGPDGQRTVHASRWDGGRWIPLGRGALNTNPGADADHSTVAAGRYGILVAWRELHGGVWRLRSRLQP